MVISLAVRWKKICGSPSGPRDFVMSSSVINWFQYLFEILNLLNIVFSDFMSLRLKLDLGEKTKFIQKVHFFFGFGNSYVVLDHSLWESF